MQEATVSEGAAAPSEAVDWIGVGRICLLSRALDDLEERELVPERLVAYQFSSRGHEVAQALLGMALGHPRDAATVYYRSRPFLLTCGLTATEALAGSMGRVGGPSGARDIGVVHSLVPRGRATVLPMSGAVGSQYTPATGWASAIRYRVEVMGHSDWDGAIAVAMGGEGSASTPGFWAALNIAAAGALPMVFMIEDNGYAISVPATVQTPGGNIARNLGAFDGLLVLDGDGLAPCVGHHRLVCWSLTATAPIRPRRPNFWPPPSLGPGPARVRPWCASWSLA
ncbi:MAG: thiamine pyrophosphate-dependent enzyme [Anaerolineae bacterium]